MRGICRIIQGLNVAANSNCRDECWEILQELVRLNCAEAHGDTMTAMRPLFDATLTYTFTSLRSKGMDHKAFWAAFSHVFHCYGVALYNAFETAFSEDKSDLKKIQDAMTVARTTTLGQKLFGKAQSLVTISAASRKMDAAVNTARSGRVTSESLAALKDL